MGINRILAVAALCLALTPVARTAETTHFGVKPIIINGTSLVFVSAIDNRGDIVGNYVSGSLGYGFLRTRKLAVASIPAPPGCTAGGQSSVICLPFPSAINDAGTIAGNWTNYVSKSGTPTFQTSAFTWQIGTPSITNTFQENSTEASGPGGQPLMNARGIIAATVTPPGQASWVVDEGPISAPAPVPGLAGATLTGINNAGTLVGRMVVSESGTPTNVGFIASNNKIITLNPPGSIAVFPLAINDRGDVAGGYWDSNIIAHGFIYRNGKFKYFETPQPTSSLSISQINNSGRVVGFWADGPFIYNGSDFTTIKSKYLASGNSENILINDAGFMVYTEYSNPLETSSYLILCAGPGC
jgi:hypothetical protein